MRKFKLAKVIFLSIFTISFLSTLSISSIWIYFQYREFKESSNEIRDEHIKSQKEMAKREVQKVIEYIRYRKSKIESEVKELLKNRVYRAYNTAKAIYEENRGIKSESEIKYMIISSLKSIDFSDKRAYYYINSNSGDAILYNFTSLLNKEVDIWNLQDLNGQYVIREQAKIAKNSKEGFLKSYFTKPDRDNSKEYPKLSFIKMFEPYDWHIGMGEYLDDIKRDTQNEILEWIANIRYGKNGYIFVNKFDGYALVFDGEKLKEPMYWENYQDRNGVEVFKEELKASNQDGGGYFYYSFKKLSNKEQTPKIGYATQFKDWNWIIGSGVYVDEIERELQKKEQILLERVIDGVIVIFSLFALLTIFILLISKYIAKYIESNISLLVELFQRASNESMQIDRERFTFLEFENLAISLNRVLTTRNSYEKRLKEINIDLEKRVEMEIESRMQRERVLTQQSKFALMGEIMTNIAHQWRQPLNVVSLIIQRFKLTFHRGALTEEEMDSMVEKSMRHINQMSNTIDEFSNFFKIDTEKEEFDVKEAIESSISIISRELEKLNIQIELNIDRVISLYSFKNEFRQVILNLLNNSKDAIEENSKELRYIQIDIEQRDEVIVIRVSDSGGGVRREVADRIFEPYFSTKEQGKGSGIGLYMSKSIIVDSIGGDIEFKNQKDGAIFTIEIPTKGEMSANTLR